MFLHGYHISSTGAGVCSIEKKNILKSFTNRTGGKGSLSIQLHYLRIDLKVIFCKIDLQKSLHLIVIKYNYLFFMVQAVKINRIKYLTLR